MIKTYFTGCLALTMLLGCNINDKPAENSAPTTVFDKNNLEPCIKKELNFDTRIDIDSYEGLNIEYFHEIEDYTGKKAQKYEAALMERRALLEKNDEARSIDDTLATDSVWDVLRLMIISEIDSLKYLLRPYKKEVVGYVFVHTFKTGSDTMSVIFLMDTKCIRSEAIRVLTVPQEINPDNYKALIRAN